jgi:hypothetical protein
MMAICKRLGLDARLLCIDTWLGSHENYARHDGDNRWLHEALRLEAGYPRLHELFLSNMMHLGLTERVTPLPLPATIAARVVAEKNIVADVIYIVGSHDYEDCKADLANYWPLLRQGGILFGDDYQAWPGVTRAVDEFCDAHFLHRSIGIGDMPVAIEQLHGFAAEILDLDGVRPNIVAFFRVGLLGKIIGDNRNFDLACGACVHVISDRRNAVKRQALVLADSLSVSECMKRMQASICERSMNSLGLCACSILPGPQIIAGMP